jgi:molybdopterin molybdotransferase
VAIAGGGDELVSPGETPGPWQIFESTTLTLARLVEGWGGAPARVPRMPDRQDAIAEALGACDCELLVTIGGASVGDHDLVRPALQSLGLELLVASIAVRPGKPTFFGRLGDGRLVLGLPGNPASAMVGAELFLKPILMAFQGADPAVKLEHARLAEPVGANGGREQWGRASLVSTEDGVLAVRAFPEEDSSLVSVFARADALVRRPADAPPAEAGTVVEVLRLARL